MISSYQEIVSHSGFDFETYLDQLNLFRIFEPIFQEYNDKELCKKIIKYIVYTHSINSSKLSIGGDRRKEVARVFKDMEIDKEHYDDLVLLGNDAVVKSCQYWMQYQDSRQIEYLITLQNEYVQQQAASLKNILKSTGEIDFDQKMRCIEHITELKKMIKDAESELQQNDPKLKEAHEEIKKSSSRSTLTATDAFKI